MNIRKLEQFRNSGSVLSIKLLVVIFIGVIALVLLSAVALWSLRKSIINENVAKVRALSEVARETANFFHKRAERGEFSKEEAQQLTRNVLRSLNYSEIEDFFVYDLKGNCILLPQKPDREGKNWLDLQDEDGVYPIRTLLDSAKRGGQPVYYRLFPRNESSHQQVKMVVAVPFEPWGWAIGTGIFMENIDKQFWSAALRMGGIILAIAILCITTVLFLMRNIAMTFERQTELLHEYFNSSQTDALTGCNNRRSFLEKGGRDFALAKRHGKNLSALMIDIDHFKLINDAYGHPCGDKVLISLVHEIQRSIRGTDVFARIGGEEFALILGETPLNESSVIAEKLREQIAGLTLTENGKKISFTISIGVASMNSMDDNLESLLYRADMALYRAKVLGRNHVCIDDEVAIQPVSLAA